MRQVGKRAPGPAGRAGSGDVDAFAIEPGRRSSTSRRHRVRSPSGPGWTASSSSRWWGQAGWRIALTSRRQPSKATGGGASDEGTSSSSSPPRASSASALAAGRAATARPPRRPAAAAATGWRARAGAGAPARRDAFQRQRERFGQVEQQVGLVDLVPAGVEPAGAVLAARAVVQRLGLPGAAGAAGQVDVLPVERHPEQVLRDGARVVRRRGAPAREGLHGLDEEVGAVQEVAQARRGIGVGGDAVPSDHGLAIGRGRVRAGPVVVIADPHDRRANRQHVEGRQRGRETSGGVLDLEDGACLADQVVAFGSRQPGPEAIDAHARRIEPRERRPRARVGLADEEQGPTAIGQRHGVERRQPGRGPGAQAAQRRRAGTGRAPPCRQVSGIEVDDRQARQAVLPRGIEPAGQGEAGGGRFTSTQAWRRVASRGKRPSAPSTTLGASSRSRCRCRLTVAPAARHWWRSQRATSRAAVGTVRPADGNRLRWTRGAEGIGRGGSGGRSDGRSVDF